MNHTVSFTVKCDDKRNIDYQRVEDRRLKFKSFPRAVKFARNIRGEIGDDESLVGTPIIEEAA